VTIDQLIEKWWGLRGGAERSNLGPFIHDLCAALQLPHPGPASAGILGNYEFEGSVPAGSFRSAKATGYIDLYKRGCFVLEAKQSQLPVGQQPSLFEPAPDAPQAPSGARYDQLMRDARAQAENYAKNLPGEHPPVPFIIVCDVGRAFEIEFDYTGNGRGYGFFPDKQSYRIELPELRDPKIAERLRNIWIDPDAENPRLRSAEVTSGIARRLAQVSQYLEATNRYRAREAGPEVQSQMIEETSLFLMRIIFCMFAEDIGLLPKDRFKAFLEGTIEDQTRFAEGLDDLWTKMNSKGGGFAWAVNDVVKYFNGGLFESGRTFVISNADRGELFQAAKADWKKVEPAIFGTLLEQALSKEERAKLGAHYTPRPYVERLVQATIMDVLEPEWAAISSPVAAVGVSDDDLTACNDPAVTLAAAAAFHARIAALRILDPACGTGNFLYVAMEALQQLEAKVIETIQTLGGKASAKVGPHQFFGLELNPRAAKIAELVLWIGWLRFRIANDPGDVHDPVLDSTANINFGGSGRYDALLALNDAEEPIIATPRAAEWPEADFIIGNPPFIGKGSAMRQVLGDEYVGALRTTYPDVPSSTDLVMYWWDRAAALLVVPESKLIRFGFVTTNLIRGSLNRKVVARHLESSTPLSLVFAIPDHPWTKASKDAAAVRIAMSVAERGGNKIGLSLAISREEGLKTDAPTLEFVARSGRIHADLKTGTDLTHLTRLAANKGLSSNGMMLAGAGFKLSASEAQHLLNLDGPDTPLRPYVSGSEIMQKPKHRFVIDLFGLDEKDARQNYPASYTHLLDTVKDSRKYNNKSYRAKRWWEFGENNPLMRDSLNGLNRYIATTETTKHRVFQFIDGSTLPDHMIIGISLDDPYFLGILSSVVHIAWTLAISSPLGVATMEQGHRYNKSQIFDPFPFPDASPAQRKTITDLGEELDATRKAALTDAPGLTITELYNLRDKLRSGSLSKLDRDRATTARAAIVNRLHEQLDVAVSSAYGWSDDLPPSEIVARLAALNAARAAEEKTGKVRWLRPDYQEQRFGKNIN
jgi:hypothetical protein